MQHIPVFRIVREAYAFLWQQRRDFLVLGVPALVVFAILATLKTVWFPELSSDLGDGAEPDTPGSAFALLILPMIVTWCAVWIMFAVAWHRKYLVPHDDVTVRAAYRWGPRHTRFLGAAIVVGLWAALTFAIVLFPAIAVSGIYTRFSDLAIGGEKGLWGGVPPEPWVFVMMGLVVWAIAELSVAVVAARYLMLLPSSAVGQRMSSTECWKFTHGNGWRLALIHVLIAIPIVVITRPIDVLSDTEGFIADSAAVFFDQLVWFVGLALGISALSIAYRRLTAVMSPAPATGE